MLLPRRLWNKRGINGLDWSDSSLSIADGIPRATCIGWGKPALEIGIINPATKPLEEVADGFSFELAADRLIQFQRRSTITLPESKSWLPEFGGTVVEFILDSKPGVTDRVDGEYWFPIKLRLIDPTTKLFYQGKLSEEPSEPGEVRSRPEWCVGSYAVYAADGRKLGHIPKPFAYDSKGAFLWGRWAGNPLDGVLYKAFPVLEMDALVPPLVIDATFGYESQGGSSSTPSVGIQRATGAYNPGATWNAATIQGYFQTASGTTGATTGIFSSTGGTPKLAANILRDTNEVTITNTPGWFEFTLDSVYQVQNGVYYHPGWHHNSAQQVTYWYDGNGYQLSYQTMSYSAGTLANFSSPSYVSRRVSIYVLEEEAAVVTGNIVQTMPRWRG